MNVINCTRTPPTDLLELFEEYPYKEYQKRFQGIDSAAMARYHLAGLLNERGEPDLALSDADGRTLAFGRRTESKWHSEILGVRFYRLQPLLWREGYEAALGPLLEAALTDIPKGSVMETRLDIQALDAGADLTATGFRQIGTSVKLSAKSTDLTFPEAASVNCSIRPARAPEDFGAIDDVVRAAHVTSHFYNQRIFSKEKVEDLFAGWTRRCIEKIADRVLVAESEGRVAGFVTLLVNRGVARATGTPVGVIDFVAVSPEFQGQGIGTALLSEGIEFLRKECEVLEIRTELDNFPAIRAYQRLGFRITSADRIWHRCA